MKPGQFVIVTAEIWNLHELKPRERVFLALLAGFSRKGGACTMSNVTLGEWMGVSARMIQVYIRRLQDAGHIEVENRGGRRLRVKKSSPGGEAQFVGGRSFDVAQGEAQFTHIEKKPKKKQKHIMEEENELKPPSLYKATAIMTDVVRAEAACRHVPVESVRSIAAECLAYYDRRGNRTKSGPVNNWRAILESWIRRQAEKIPVNNRPVREQTMDDVRWMEKRSKYWQRRANECEKDDPRREDFERYAYNHKREAEELRRQIERRI